MKEILKYHYTGKLRVDISNIMGVVRISAFLGLDQLTQACKQYLLNGFLNAFDLCILYCEVRDEAADFEDMRAFLCRIIPDKVDSDILCRVLREIWVTPIPRSLSEHNLSEVIENSE